MRKPRVKRCQRWPHCDCQSSLDRWRNELSDPDRVWEPEMLEWAETDIFLSLSCMSHHCPGPLMRAYAIEQLSDPYWIRQKLMGR